jgi:hypothetical protein
VRTRLAVGAGKRSGAGLRRTLRGPVLAGALPLLLLVPLLELWNADLSVPLYGGGDVPFTRMLVAGIEENGGFLENPRLGAPLGQELRDYPEVDAISFLLLRVLVLFTSDPDVALNLFYLATFPLTSLAAYFVLRRHVGWGPAVVASVLFSLLPYHFARNESHLFLAAYWAIPFAAHLLLLLLSGEPAFVRRVGETGVRAWITRRSLTTVGACLVVGSTWFYYSAYALILLAAAAVVALVVRPRRETLATAGALLATTGLVLALNVAPYVVHRISEGANTAYAKRQAEESEQYSLKLMQLVTPIEQHRIGRFGRFSRHYARTAPSQSEAESAHLGAVGALGLAWLLVAGVAAAVAAAGRPWLARFGPAAAATLIAFLFATNGALGSLVGYTITPQLRAWTRLSVFIAFFALLAVALTLDGLRPRLRTGTFVALLAGVLAVGVLDQTSRAYVPDYEALERTEHRDAAFVGGIESRLPAGASVFQLPYVSFPEAPVKEDLPFYDQLRGYIHSRDLRWSFGDVTGRPEEWRDDLEGKPVRGVVEAVAAIGFAGIEVSRRGYADRAAGIESELRSLLAGKPLVSDDGNVAFYDLRPVAERLRRRIGSGGIAALREVTLHPAPAP